MERTRERGLLASGDLRVSHGFAYRQLSSSVASFRRAHAIARRCTARHDRKVVRQGRGELVFFSREAPDDSLPTSKPRDLPRSGSMPRRLRQGSIMWEIIFWLFLWICILDISYYIFIISFCVYFRCDRQAVRGRSPPGEDARPLITLLLRTTKIVGDVL